MGMTRFASSIFVAFAALAGCNKPSKEDCRKAIENMRALMHTTQLHTDVEGEVRRCNGGSRKEAVDCAIKANTIAELRECKFMHIPDEPDTGSAAPTTGSAAPTTGSGSAAPASGSAAPATGSADGAAAPTTGSATGSGSAATGSGSVATGSGSAAGSAAPSTGSAGSATGSQTGSSKAP